MAKPSTSATLNTAHALCPGMHFWPLNEGVGSTAKDYRGNNTATLSGTAGWGANGLTFSADGDKAALASTITYPFSSCALTVAFSAKQTTSGSQGMVCGNDASTNSFIWMNGGSQLLFRCGGDPSWSGVTDFTARATYHLVRQVDGVVRLYKNGALVTPNTGQADGTGFIVNALGSGYSGHSFSLIGELDWVAIHNGAWDAATVASHAADPFAAFEEPASGGTFLSQVMRHQCIPPFLGSM